MRLSVHGRALFTATASCLLAVSALGYLPTLRAQEFTQGPNTIELYGPTAFPGGRYAFQDVYCVQFPQHERIRSISEGLLGNGGISYYRAVYPDERLAAHIVTSTLPADLDERSDFEAQLHREQQNATIANAASDGERYRVRVRPGHPQPVLEVAITNIARSRDRSMPKPTRLRIRGRLIASLCAAGTALKSRYSASRPHPMPQASRHWNAGWTNSPTSWPARSSNATSLDRPLHRTPPTNMSKGRHDASPPPRSCRPAAHTRNHRMRHRHVHLDRLQD